MKLSMRKRKKNWRTDIGKSLVLLKMNIKRLTFCAEKLFRVKQQMELNSFEFFSHNYTHFSTLNGKTYDNIKQIVD